MKLNIFAYLPIRLRQALAAIPPNVLEALEEIRIRVNQPLEIIFQNRSMFVKEDGTLANNAYADKLIQATSDDADKLINMLSRHSIYALEEELKRGFITITGGHRVGIAGKVITEQGRIARIHTIRSFNIRIAKQCLGVGKKVLPYLVSRNRFLNTLIISPPRCGKTTLLRDLTRLLSYGEPVLRLQGKRIGVVDERSEIASCIDGIPQNDIGPRTDVLDACPKAEGMMMLVRSMSPEIIVTDEIGSIEDAAALKEAIHAGVKLLTTAHGSSLEEVSQRPSLQQFFKQYAFERYIILSLNDGVGTIEAILNQDGSQLLSRTESLRGRLNA